MKKAEKNRVATSLKFLESVLPDEDARKVRQNDAKLRAPNPPNPKKSKKSAK